MYLAQGAVLCDDLICVEMVVLRGQSAAEDPAECRDKVASAQRPSRYLAGRGLCAAARPFLLQVHPYRKL